MSQKLQRVEIRLNSLLLPLNGVNLKVVQATLGHADATTTLNIYAKCTEDLKKREFELLSDKLSSEEEARAV